MIDREKMEGHCSTGQSPLRAVEPMEEEQARNKCYRMLAPYTLGIIPHPVCHSVQQLLSNQHVPNGWIYLW